MNGPEAAPSPRWLHPWSLDEGSDRARALFVETFGGEPDAVVSAPGRLTIIGDHTDYSGGLSLAAVTAHRTFIAVRRRDDQAIRAVSAGGDGLPGPGPRWEGAVGALEPGDEGWPSRIAGVVWALGEHGYPQTGLDIAMDSCLPARVGLGTSASVMVATGLACDAVWGLGFDSPAGAIALAEACWEADDAFVGFPGGRLDSHTILRCAEGDAALLDFSRVPPGLTRYPLSFREYGLRLLITDTGPRRPGWGESYAERSRDAARGARALGTASLRELADQPDALDQVAGIEDETLHRRVRHAVTEHDRVRECVAALSGLGPAHDRFTEIGAIMLASHRSLHTDYEVSTPQLDLAVDAAVAAGALGARLMGAGFGGCALALVRATSVDRIAAEIDGRFVASGYERPLFLLA